MINIQLSQQGLSNTLTSSLQTPTPPNKCPGYETKLFDGDASDLFLSNSGFAYFCYILKTFKNNTPYTRKQPLMMAYEGFKSARDNFGNFIYQFQPETKTLIIRKHERILNKLYRQNLSLLFNETCLNE